MYACGAWYLQRYHAPYCQVSDKLERFLMYTDHSHFLPALSSERAMPVLPGLSLDDFMRRTRVYENSSIPIAPQLRRSALIGTLFTALACTGLVILPPLRVDLHGLDVNWFSGLNRILDSSMAWIVYHTWLDYVEGVFLLSVIPLSIITHWLRRGPLWQHVCVCVYVLIGVLNLLAVLAMLVLVLTNLLFWIFVALIGLTLALGILYAMFARR